MLHIGTDPASKWSPGILVSTIHNMISCIRQLLLYSKVLSLKASESICDVKQ